ncbi:MAG: hypothetical protein PVJ72_05670 [Gammaproteobacteria bacterium]|jgi:hypothetical protein
MTDFNEYTLGESKQKIQIETIEENRLAAIALAKQASRSLHIFSHDLDPMIYDNNEFVDAVKELAIGHSQAELQIIIQDSRKIVENGHRIIELARRISSRIHIRKTPLEMKSYSHAFLIVDKTGVLYRTIGDRFEGYVNFDDRFESKKLLDFFASTWEHSAPDPELRRLHI